MNSATTKPQSSNQNRWLVLAGVIFVIQLALVWLMGEHWQASAPTRVPAPVGLLPKALSDDQIADNIFASHPTLFPEPSRHGFSGGAWLHGPSQAYTTPERNEPEHWLKLPTDRLATTLPAIAPKGSDVPFELAAQNDPAVELRLMNLPPELVRTNSSLLLQGPLAARMLDWPTELPTWSLNQPVTNSVIQIAVNGAGEVVSALLLGRSGWPAADNAAMEQARNLHFRPAATLLSPTARGKIVFEWMTFPATNNSVPPP